MRIKRFGAGHWKFKITLKFLGVRFTMELEPP